MGAGRDTEIAQPHPSLFVLFGGGVEVKTQRLLFSLSKSRGGQRFLEPGLTLVTR
jgi:hypothetical protein